jgi:hypothetical protein
MPEGDWCVCGWVLAAGLLIGIPIGVVLLWFFTQPSAPQISPQQRTATPQTSYTNEEKWTWIDYKGRRREIVVKREAKEANV